MDYRKKNNKPGHLEEDAWVHPLHWMDVIGKHMHESYAEHLARVQQDVDRSKSMLQAHYKALHAADPNNTDS